MKKFLYSLFAFMAIVACSNGEDIIPEIKLESSLANFTEDGGSTIINFTSTDVWTAEVDNSNDWCRVSPESGKAGKISLIISAEANSVIEDRTATVMVKSGTVKKTITISQNRKSIITSAQDEYTVDGKGEKLEIEVEHNVDFDITIDCEWITFDQTRTLETDKLTFVIAENERTYSRTGYITLSAKDDGIATKEITIKQNGGIFEIHYTSLNGQIVSPSPNSYWGGAKIVSNVYEDGKGIISFDKKVTAIDGFNDCITLKSINIPNGVTSIDYGAFEGCELLESVNIPNSITQIGGRAFLDCKMLQHIIIPDGVKSIDIWTFYNCHSLTSIEMPNSIESIEYQAFRFCYNLTNINLSDNITKIGEMSFQECKSLTSIDIPDGVVSIGYAAFCDCEGLTSINIPKGITKIEDSTFKGCINLSSVNIPDSVVSIGDFAFRSCGKLTSIDIPDGVNLIGKYAFEGCSNLKNIIIPEHITTIKESTFAFCKSLSNIDIPNGVTSIGEWAFGGCSNLTSIDIPSGIISIGDYTFYNCTSLNSVCCKPTTPPSVGEYAFNYNATERKIYVPQTSVDAYKAADGWKEYADDIIGYDLSNE